MGRNPSPTTLGSNKERKEKRSPSRESVFLSCSASSKHYLVQTQEEEKKRQVCKKIFSKEKKKELDVVTYAHNPGTEEYQQLETSLGYAVHSGAPLRGRGTERGGGQTERSHSNSPI